MKKYKFEDCSADSAYISPELYGQLARVFCSYLAFWPCKKVISEFMRENTLPVDEKKMNENVLYFFADIYLFIHDMVQKNENNFSPHIKRAKALDKLIKTFESTHIDQEAISPYNIMQILQHIHFTFILLQRQSKNRENESAKLKFLRSDVFSSLCLATLNNFSAKYRDASWQSVCGAHVDTSR